MTDIEKIEEMLRKEQEEMKGGNVGCEPSMATKIEKELVKADGNCLFNCASLAMEGTVDKPTEMRQNAAAIMLSNPEKFSREELGKDPQAYVEWLTSGPHAWGGIPELKALSDLYGVEFGVVVIQDIEVLLFGHNKGLAERIYVLFDGTHYNLCVHKPSHNAIPTRRFSPTDERAYQGMLELAKVCKSKNEDIDPAIFSLVCYECSKGLIG